MDTATHETELLIMVEAAMRARSRTLSLATLASLILLAGCAGTPGDDIAQSPSASASLSSAPTETPSPSASVADPSPSPEASNESVDEAPGTTIPGASAVLTLATWDAAAGTILVGGFVSGVAEDGGECLFVVTATDTESVVSLESQGGMNVDSTTCGSHDVEAPTSQTGSYRVQMTYTNAAGTATSEPLTVEAP